VRSRGFDDDEAVIMVVVGVLARVEAAVSVVCEQRQANV
jgi:Fe-S cluster assembly scaffold protein SufB